MNGISALIRETRALSFLLSCLDSASRWPSRNREVGPHQTPNLPVPLSWVFQPPKQWEINDCFSHQVYVFFCHWFFVVVVHLGFVVAVVVASLISKTRGLRSSPGLSCVQGICRCHLEGHNTDPVPLDSTTNSVNRGTIFIILVSLNLL